MNERTTVTIGALLLGTVLLACTQLARVKEVPAVPSRKLWNTAGEGPRIHEVLIAIDGTRWQDIFHGTDPALADAASIPLMKRKTADELTPNLHALMRAGSSLGDDDAPFSASGPNFVSLPGYVEMFGGHRAACQENACDDVPVHTFLDSFREAGAKHDEVAVISSWERIGNVATRDASSIFISSGRTDGSTQQIGSDPILGPLWAAGAKANPAPGHQGYRPDSFTAPLAVAYLREKEPRFLFVGLGDTDEHGHEGDYRAYLEALRASDDMIGEMMGIASDWRARGERVIFIVTTDHGREAAFKEHGRDHPESARSWVVVSGDGIRQSELPSSSEPRALSDLAPTIERLAGIVSTSTDQTGTVMADLIAEPPSTWDRRTLVGAVETRPMRGAASPVVQ